MLHSLDYYYFKLIQFQWFAQFIKIQKHYNISIIEGRWYSNRLDRFHHGFYEEHGVREILPIGDFAHW